MRVGILVALVLVALLVGVHAFFEFLIVRYQDDRQTRYLSEIKAIETSYPGMRIALELHFAEDPKAKPNNASWEWRFFQPRDKNFECIRFGSFEDNGITARYIGYTIWSLTKILTVGMLSLNPLSDNKGVYYPFLFDIVGHKATLVPSKGLVEDLQSCRDEDPISYHIVWDNDRAHMEQRVELREE